MMEKMRNDEKSDKNAKGIYVMCLSDSAIGAESTLSWISDDEEECIEVTEHYQKRRWMKRNVP